MSSGTQARYPWKLMVVAPDCHHDPPFSTIKTDNNVSVIPVMDAGLLFTRSKLVLWIATGHQSPRWL